jgi:hypothetical protein
VPTVTNLTSGAGSAATSFATASVAPTGNRLILVSVHAYISTGSVQPATPTVTGNGITYTLVQAQDVDTSGVDRATEWVFRGLATSPSSGAITISFGAVTMTRCAWSVDQSDSDIDLSGVNGAGAIAQKVGATSAGATSLSVSYSPAMRSDSAGYSAWGHQVQEVKTPRTSWTELSDVTSVTLATMETQFFSGTDTAASASWTTSSRAGGIAIEIKKAAPFIWSGEYGLQGGTTGLTMIPPAGTVAGDLDVIWVLNKNSSVDPTDPGSGWLRIGSAELGTGADGVGTGKIRFTAWYRILTGASTNTTVSAGAANRMIGGGMTYHLTGAGAWTTPTIAFGEDVDASTTAFVALMTTDLAAGVDDYTLSVGGFTAITTLPGRSLTIPNSTQSRLDNINSAGGAVGNTIFAWSDQRVGMVGTQSGAATTGATSGVGTTGGAMQIRIRMAGTTTVSGTRATTWRALTQITATRGTTWRVLTAAVGSRASTWRVRSAVTATRATTWRVAATVASLRATTWDVLTSTVASRATTWRTRAQVTPTRATTWRTRSLAVGARVTTWNVDQSATVVATRSTTWAVAGRVTSTRSTTWDTLTRTTVTRATTWDATAVVSAARSTTWRTRQAVQASKNTTWRVRATTTAPRTTTWNTATRASSSASAIWRTLAATSSSRAANWRLLEVVAATRSTGWAVASNLVPQTGESVLTASNSPSSVLVATNPRPTLTPSNAPSSQLEVSHGV